MPAALTTASTLQCVHGGTVTATASSSALTVGGSPVLVQADLATATITNCPNTNASAGQVPCVAITSVATGASTTLTVAGQPAMLATASGLTNGSPPLPVMWQVVSAGQTLLSAS
jgi:hypothetical protein